MRITRYTGMRPVLDNTQLDASSAEYCENVRLTDGTLRQEKEHLLFGQCQTESFILDECKNLKCMPLRSLYVYDCGAQDVISVVNKRLTHSDGVQVGVDRPLEAPLVTGAMGDVAFAVRYSLVNSWGEESRKSPPLNLMGKWEESYSVLANIPQGMTLRLYAGVSSLNEIEKQLNANSSVSWHVVGDFDANVSFYLNLEQWDLASGLDSDDWLEPFDVHGIVQDEDNHFYAWDDRKVFVSENGLYSAWPVVNVVELNHNIKEVVSYLDTAFVLTDGYPYLIRHPVKEDGSVHVNVFKYRDPYPYVSGHAQTGFGCIYASNTALITLTPSAPDGLVNVTPKWIEIDKFEQYIPKCAAWHKGVYYGATNKGIYAFDLPDNNNNSKEFQTLTWYSAKADYLYSSANGLMYFKYQGNVYEFGGSDSYLNASWDSKIFVENGWRVLTRSKVVGQNIEGVKVSYFADGSLYYVKTLTAKDNNRGFALPAKRGMEYQVKYVLPKSNLPVQIRETHIAATEQDLTNVS